MSMGLPIEASAGRNLRNLSRVARESRMHLQAVRLACVRAQDPEAARVRDDRDAVALRGGWFARIVATSNISSSVSVRITPD